MSKLGQVVEAVEKYNKFVLDQVKRARTDQKFGRELLGRWNDIKAKIPVTRTPTGLPLPRLALPEIDEAGRDRALSFRRRFAGRISVFSTARIARCISSRFARSRRSLRKRTAERSQKNGKQDGAKPQQA